MGVIIDLERAAVDYASAHAMIASTQGFDCAPKARIVKEKPAYVKRAREIDAEGVVFSLIGTARNARA
ncbi:MAG: hypothetical protein AAGI09_14935 [Pseudomonadota bacterium]